MEENATTESNQSLFSHALKFGAIMGVIGIILTLVLYAVDYTLLADWKTGIIMLLLFLGLLIYAGINYRNEVGGYLSYGKAFQHGFITLAVGGIIGIAFNIILYTVIDPDFPQKITDVTVEKTTTMLQGFGMSEDKIDEAVEKVRTDTPARYSVIGQIKGFLWALIAYAVISSITSLFVRRNQPVEL